MCPCIQSLMLATTDQSLIGRNVDGYRSLACVRSIYEGAVNCYGFIINLIGSGPTDLRATVVLGKSNACATFGLHRLMTAI